MEVMCQFWRDSSGSNMMEYALPVAFVAITLVEVLQNLSSAVGGVFTKAQAGLDGSG